MGPTPKCHFVRGLPSGSLEILTIGTSATLGAHNFTCRPPIDMKFEAKLYPLLRAFQQYVTHHLHTRKSGDSWLLVVRSQIVNLIFGPFFYYNLCVKWPNRSCEHILNIYVPRAFQWYKEIFNPMGFCPYNFFLKIRESIRTPTSKVGAQLGLWGFIPSHSLALPGAWNVTPRLHTWPTPSQALALVANLRLWLRHQQSSLIKTNSFIHVCTQIDKHTILLNSKFKIMEHAMDKLNITICSNSTTLKICKQH